MDYNRLMLAGRLVRDLRQFQGQSSAGCAGTIAVNEKRGSEHESLFMDFRAFGKTAEAMLQYLHKGSSVFLEGKIVIDEWADKATGVKKTRASMLAFHWTFCNSKSEDAIDSTCPIETKAEPDGNPF